MKQTNDVWFYVFKPNEKEGAQKKRVANLVLPTADGVEYIKKSVGKKPERVIYKKFINYTDGKNKVNKSLCIDMEETEFTNDLKSLLDWNDRAFKEME